MTGIKLGNARRLPPGPLPLVTADHDSLARL
jgi:hypothetical protein